MAPVQQQEGAQVAGSNRSSRSSPKILEKRRIGRNRESRVERTRRAAATRAKESMVEPRVEPVVLLKGRPATRFQLLGMVEAKGTNRRRSENGLAIRAAMMGADAVVDSNAERLPGFIRTEHRSSGTAVRAVDHEGRLELKSRWFDSQINRIRIPMLIIACFFGGVSEYVVAGPDGTNTVAPIDPFLSQSARSLTGFLAWLFITSLTVGMSFLRWPQLVRPTAVCFLAKAVQNGLSIAGGLAGIVVLTFGLWTVGMESFTTASASAFSAVMIPATILNIIFSFSFLLFYLYLGRLAWRIDQEFRRLAANSTEPAAIPILRRWAGRLGWAMAIVFALIVWVREMGQSMQSVADKAVSAQSNGSGPMGKTEEALGSQMNQLAWRQATDPDPAKRSAAEAIKNALQAVEYRPENPRFLQTLGVARYRTGDYSGAIADLEKHIRLGGPSVSSTFFLAMARPEGRARSGQKVVRRRRPANARNEKRRRRADALSRGSSRGALHEISRCGQAQARVG